MKRTKGLILTTLLLVLATVVKAQENKVDVTISADLVSQYIWRGLDLGQVSIQPSLDISYKGFSFSAWGNWGITDSTDDKEFDLTLAYAAKGFNIGITDFHISQKFMADYFNYSSPSTLHTFEVNLGYDFGVANIQWYTIFAGCDSRTEHDKRAYSSYAEINVPFDLIGISWEGTVGCVPYATDYYEVGGFAVTNLSVKATKEIAITKHFSIPVFAGLTYNPHESKVYGLVGVTFSWNN